MIELLAQQIKKDMPPQEKLNRLQEALQLAVLKIMYDRGHLNNLAFVGGTHLRIIFNMRRFSEDLDFSLVDKKGYNFAEISTIIERELGLLGLKVEPNLKVEKTVQSNFLKFSGLLEGLGLSALDTQKLSIKVEVDSNPPEGWRLETTLVNKIYLLNLPHFDLPSSFACKLSACFFRKYTKGRDFYDLLWYLGKKNKPNIPLLNNAIAQTQGLDLRLNEQNIKAFILDKLKDIDFTAARKDVERFLEDKTELELLNFDVLAGAVEKLFTSNENFSH